MAVQKEQNRLMASYKNSVIPALKEHFKYENINEVPKLVKIVINTGLGDVKDNSKSFQLAVDEIKMISGQKPLVTKAKKSVANFKVRVWLSARKLLCVTAGCTNSWTNLSPSLFLASETSTALILTLSTAEATTLWVSKSNSSSLKFNTTKLKKPGALT